MKLRISIRNLEEMDSKRTDLMKLPCELRNKIYGYLLCVDRIPTKGYGGRNTAELDLSILYVSKAIYSEASTILYDANPWVCIVIESSLLQTLRGLEKKERIEDFLSGGKSFPNASYDRVAAVALAHLRMDLPFLPRHRSARDWTYLVVSLFAIPRLGRLLTIFQFGHKIELAVFLRASNAGKAKENRQERLLDYLSEARGICSAMIVDAQNNESHQDLTKLMMSPFKGFQDFLDRASTYQGRALQKEKRGRLSEACCDYQDCYDLTLWFWYSIAFDDVFPFRGQSPIEIIARLLHTIAVSCAVLYINLGDLDSALSALDWIWKFRSTELEYEAETEVWFRCGLRDLAKGAANGAAYCFLQTLRKQPGHAGADEAVDQMESRLRSCAGSNECSILHNIQHVLQPFRHQPHDGAVVSEARYRALTEQWHAGKEMDDSDRYRRNVRCSGYPDTRGMVNDLSRRIPY